MKSIDPILPKVPTAPKVPKGKAIYQTTGKAAEYAEYACNFYLGCTCACTYCYNKTGRFKATMGGDFPTLKKCFKNETHALRTFGKELQTNLPELRKHGLFFSFSTDPFLPETIELTVKALILCARSKIPVKILTKSVKSWLDLENGRFRFTEKHMLFLNFYHWREYTAFGFSLTGHDELEPGASTNAERIDAMCKLYSAGFKTFASIEPVIDCDSSVKMMWETQTFCNLYKVGLQSGKKYDKGELLDLISDFNAKSYLSGNHFKIYYKDSLLKAAGVTRSELPRNCVTKDYNIFNNK